jgi:hypothetical protein
MPSQVRILLSPPRFLALFFSAGLSANFGLQFLAPTNKKEELPL